MSILIKRLRLKNIKSYVDAEIEFKEGINGILGENGHGKTTILEAIGYCLFDYLPINKKDFVRKGEKSGEVSLTIQLSDGLEYEIKKGVEKQLYKITLGSGKELKTRQDCEDWLLDTVFPGTGSISKVGDLFSNMIGVPQGQFTTAFLQTPANRKTTFDGILSLDQYEEVWSGLKVVNSAIDKEVEEVEKKIMYLRGQAEGLDENKSKMVELLKQLETIDDEIDAVVEKLEKVQAEANRQEALQKRSEHISKEIAGLEKESARISGELESARTNLKNREAAEKVLRELEGKHGNYLEAREKVEELRKDMDALSKKREELSRLKERRKYLEKENEKTEKRLKEVEASKKYISKEPDLLEKLETLEDRRRDLEGKLAGLEERQRSKEEKEGELEELKELASDAAKLEKELDDAKKRLKDLAPARKELDEAKELLAAKKNEISQLMKFSETLEGGKCPFLAEKCRQIEGDLNDYFGKQIKKIQADMKPLADMRTELEKKTSRLEELEKELKGMEYELNSAVEAEGKVKKLEAELKKLDLKGMDELRRQVHAASVDIQKLKPRAEEFRKHSAAAEKEEELNDSIRSNTDEIKGIKKETGELEKELKDLPGLEKKLSENQSRQKELEGDYKRYEQESGVVKKFAGVDKDIARFEKKQKTAMDGADEKQKELDGLGFESKVLKQTRDDLGRAKAEHAKLMERKQGIDKEKNQLDAQVKKQEEALSRVRVMELDIEQKRQFRLFVNFVRDTIRSAGPLIGTEMIGSIGRTASEVYCEILSDHSQQLTWTKEYDIEVASPEGNKTFKQLSGGEQMSAALALRLAMLKHLAHSDMVFLDEPTQNLDDERRSNLAQQITRVTGFDQMFIITHDDTFTQDYGSVIRVTKTRGVSEVGYE